MQSVRGENLANVVFNWFYLHHISLCKVSGFYRSDLFKFLRLFRNFKEFNRFLQLFRIA